MGWPEAAVGIVGLVVVLASVAGTVYTARTSIRAEAERQRRDHEVDRKRSWASQAAEAAARAEMAMAALAGLEGLEPALIEAARLEDLQARLDTAATVRVRVRTVLALSDDEAVAVLLEEVERRLQVVSVIVAALVNVREITRADRTEIARVADVHRSAFLGAREGEGEEPPRSLSARLLYQELRAHIGRINREVVRVD